MLKHPVYFQVVDPNSNKSKNKQNSVFDLYLHAVSVYNNKNGSSTSERITFTPEDYLAIKVRLNYELFTSNFHFFPFEFVANPRTTQPVSLPSPLVMSDDLRPRTSQSRAFTRFISRHQIGHVANRVPRSSGGRSRFGQEPDVEKLRQLISQRRLYLRKRQHHLRFDCDYDSGSWR